MSDDAHAVLSAIQGAVDSRDPERLAALFDEQAVLIGTAADARDRDAVVAYLANVAEQGGKLRWDYDDVVEFHRDGDALGFAGFGEVVLGDFRAPFRATILAVNGRIRSFHGSIPTGAA